MAKIQPNAAAASTKPQGEDTGKKAKKEKKAKREAFNLVGSKDPNVYPFKSRDVNGTLVATPEGYDYRKNAPLKKKDFAKPSMFLTYAAERAEAAARSLREKAELARKGGDQKGGGKIGRLQKTAAKMAELRKELEAQGFDVDALLSNTKPAEPAKAAEVKVG